MSVKPNPVPKTVKKSETYEYVHKDTTYEVTANYCGDDSLIDVIKAALKRNFELKYSGSNDLFNSGNGKETLD